MKVYTFGNAAKPVILLLPGTCCHWKINFERHIPYLTEEFYVNVVSYDGFDETENAEFISMLDETEKIEDYIIKNFGGSIFAAYGCSLGGSFVGLLIQRKRVHIAHGIIGSSDLDQSGKLAARLMTRLVTPILAPVLQKGKVLGVLKKHIEKLDEHDRLYMETMLEAYTNHYQGMPFITKTSMRNQFYSDLVTPLEDGIRAEGTTIHVFYAVKMGEKYKERYLQHFAEPDICCHDYQHEELFFGYPELWFSEVKRVCWIGQNKEQSL